MLCRGLVVGEVGRGTFISGEALPQHRRSQSCVAAAARRDISLTPSTTFAVSPGHAPNAVRPALAAPAMEQLDVALRTLVGMLDAREDDL